MKRFFSKSEVVLPLVVAALCSGMATLIAWTGAPQVWFEVSMVAPLRAGTAQLFFDLGRGNVEADSFRIPVVGGETPVVYRFPLPATGWRDLRFDPVERGNCEVVMRNARIVGRGGRIIRELPPTAFTLGQQIQKLEVRGDELRVTMGPNDGDPCLGVSIGAPLSVEALLPGFLRFGVSYFLLWFVPFLLLGVLLARLVQYLWRPAIAWGRSHPCRIILVVALASSALSCYPVVFFGRSFVSPNAAMLYEGPLTLPGMHDPVIEDTKGADVGAMFWQNLPYSFLQSRALGKYHELPLWNRYNSSGTIHLGQGLTMFGDPLHLLVLAAKGASWAWDLKFVLAKALFCWGIGLAVFFSAKHLPSSILLTFSAGFIGFFSYRFSHPAFFSMCYAPWILVCWLGVTKAMRVRAAACWAAGLIVASWAEVTSGSAKEAYMLLVSLHVCGLIGFLFAAVGNKCQKLLHLLSAGVVFVLMAAPVWFTFVDALASHFSSYRGAHAVQIQPSLLIGLFDEIFYRRLNQWAAVYDPSANFFVLLGCLLATVHFKTLLRDRVFVVIGLGALGASLLVYGIIPATLIDRVPILGSVMHIDNTFSCVLIVLLLVLAGFGFRCLWERIDVEARRAEMVFLILGLGALACLYLGFLHAYQRPPDMFEPPLKQSGLPDSFYYVYVASLLVSALLFPRLIRTILQSLVPGRWLALAAALCLLTLHWRMGMHLNTKIGAIDDSVMNPQVRVDFGVHSAAVDFVRSRHDVSRTVGFGAILFAGYNCMIGIESIGGPDPFLNSYYRELFFATGMPSEMSWRWRVDKENLRAMSPLYDMLNVRYFLDSPRDTTISEPSLDLLASLDLQVYESRTAWPRAFFVNRVFAYDKIDEFIGMLGGNNSLPLAAVQRDDASAISATRPFLGQMEDPRQVVPARGFRLTNNTTSFAVDAPGPGAVVLTESYIADNFEVRMNGTATDYFRVNHAFRGVKIPAAGTYNISFSFWPKHFTISLWMAAAGAVLMAGWMALVYRLDNFEVAVVGRQTHS